MRTSFVQSHDSYGRNRNVIFSDCNIRGLEPGDLRRGITVLVVERGGFRDSGSIYSMAVCTSGGGITQRLSQTIFVEIGNISAEAYLIHEVLLWYIDIFMWRILRLDISEWVLLKAAIGLILTIIFVRIWRGVTAVWSKRKCRNM